LGAGTAAADGPYTWDVTVCHKWWAVNVGMGNVGRNIWEGDPPLPPEAFEPVQCPPFAFSCP
jgi:hypothetical protein